MEYFLSNVQAPALRSITFESVESKEVEGIRPEADRFPALHTLAVQDPYFAVEELEPLFSVLPTLRHIVWSTSDRSDCGGAMEDLVDVMEGSGLLPHLQQVTIDGKLTQATDVRQRLVAAIPSLTTFKVRKEYADALKEEGETGDLRQIEITTIDPTEFPPDEGWISDPSWIEVGDGAFSGWEYFKCLNID